ncbi:MAG: response regulator [Phycisphaerales bacterium]
MSERVSTLLIVDNDEGLVEALSLRFSHAGYECITAHSGSQGIALFEDGVYDAVLTDLNMPSGDGSSLIHGIRAKSGVPVIVITGFESSYKEDLQGYENVHVVKKPFEINSLIDEVEIAIGLSAGCHDDASFA